MDLRKCPNPIWTSVGHAIFSWAIFEQAWTAEANLRIFRSYGLIENNSVNDIALRVSLCTSVTVREQISSMLERIYKCNE